ncbi:MAG: sulfotransferase domain-containing protein [Bacteriovoracaceae bacterium]|nr:sulfotransferase domain-containing protein [Bacteriovoracaceae bacterium]
MNKPEFLHLGPARCATTWQARVYREHPQLFIPASKDTEYFSHQYQRGESWYLAQFKSNKKNLIAGEICHRYFWHPDAPKRAYQFNKKFKLIFTLRDPFKRILSSYLYDRTLYLKRDVTIFQYLNLPVIKQTIQYSENILRWKSLFPNDQILITYFENLYQDPKSWLMPVWKHLNVEPHWNEEWMKHTWEGRQVRSETFAHFAFQVSQLLRKQGFYQIVGKTKDNGLIEKMLYRPGKEEALFDEKDLKNCWDILSPIYDKWEKEMGPLPLGWSKA